MVLLGFDTTLASALLCILGCEGPFVFDTKIAAHNGYLDDEEKWLEKDKFTISQAGQEVTGQDLFNFLTAVKTYGANPVFDNGRTYWFEGVRRVDLKQFSFIWGC